MRPGAWSAYRDVLSSLDVEVSAGLDLLDSEDRVVEDLTDTLVGGTITYQDGAAVTCQLQVDRDLAWGVDRVRPWTEITSSTGSAWFEMGVFLLTTPARQAGATPTLWDVQGYDKLVLLDVVVPRTVSLPSGTDVLTTVRDLIAEAGGGTRVLIDSTATAVTLPAGKAWTLGDTYRTVIDDLLTTVGYDPLWCDWTGTYRSAPHQPASERGAEWTYDASDPRTMVGPDRQSHADLWAAPNHWIVLADNPGLTVPTAGNGMTTRTNQSVGAASVDSRGRTITEIVRVDAANQAALEAQADRVLSDALRPDLRWSGTTAPNPAHWRGDVIELRDDAAQAYGRFLVTSWTFDLSGGDMTHEWQAV